MAVEAVMSHFAKFFGEKVDVQAWDCDFYVFSGHKIFGPTGIGVVYGKSEILKIPFRLWDGGFAEDTGP